MDGNNDDNEKKDSKRHLEDDSDEDGGSSDETSETDSSSIKVLKSTETLDKKRKEHVSGRALLNTVIENEPSITSLPSEKSMNVILAARSNADFFEDTQQENADEKDVITSTTILTSLLKSIEADLAGNKADDTGREASAVDSKSILTSKSTEVEPTPSSGETGIPESTQEDTEENIVSTRDLFEKSVKLYEQLERGKTKSLEKIHDDSIENASKISISNKKSLTFSVPLEVSETEHPKIHNETVEHAVSSTSILVNRSLKDVPAGDETDNPEKMQELVDKRSSHVVDVLDFVPREVLKTVKLRPNWIKKKSRHRTIHFKDKADGPVASKVVYLKLPEELQEKDLLQNEEGSQHLLPQDSHISEISLTPSLEEDHVEDPMHLLSVVDDIDRFLTETADDMKIEDKVSHLLDKYKNEKLRKLKNVVKGRSLNIKFGDMVKTLHKLGIPCPTNDDAGRLLVSHNRWDPDGTVVEYFSPMLRSFIPVNMRGRYRGCWTTDTCMKGINISKLPPKRDAPEGFVERGRHANIQKRYDELSTVANDEAHLDYLVEMQAFQAETLPIPIFYNMLHLGMQVGNECLRVLVQEEGFPPRNEIFVSQLQHSEQLRRKIHMYGALGLETMESKRKELGEYLPHWLKSRDEIIREIMASKDAERYQNFERNEDEVKERETARQQEKERTKSMSMAAVTSKKATARPSVASTTPVAATARKSWTQRRESKVNPEK